MAGTGAGSEVEATLNRLKGQPGVQGLVIVNQDGIPIRTTFDQEKTVQYAGLITQLCSKARSAVRELDPQVRPGSESSRSFSSSWVTWSSRRVPCLGTLGRGSAGIQKQAGPYRLRLGCRSLQRGGSIARPVWLAAAGVVRIRVGQKGWRVAASAARGKYQQGCSPWPTRGAATKDHRQSHLTSF